MRGQMGEDSENMETSNTKVASCFREKHALGVLEDPRSWIFIGCMNNLFEEIM